MTAELFKSLYDRHFDSCYCYARKLVSRIHECRLDPSDIVQEVFLEVWKNNIEFKGSAIAGLLCRINCRCIDMHRFSKTDQQFKSGLEYYSNLPIVEAEIIEETVFEKIKEAELTLSPQCKEIFKLFKAGASTSEIAQKLNLSRQHVLNQKTNAINKLRKTICL